MRRRHDVDRARIDPGDLVRTPVAHEVVEFGQRVGEVVAVDPVDGVEALTRAARVHPYPSDVARSAQEPEGFRVGGRGCDHACRKQTKQAPPAHVDP